jgi:hypothetical protein
MSPALIPGQPAGATLDDYLTRLGYESVSLTARSQYNQPAVEVQLANKRRFFLVDTGWGITTLKEGIGGPLTNITQMGVTLQDPVLGTLTNSALVLIPKLRIAHLDFVNQPARVDKLRADFVHFPYDGVIGCDFLARNSCLLDCGVHRLYLRGSVLSADQSRALEESLLRSGFEQIPLRSDFFLNLAGLANGQSMRLVVDTGASFTVLDDSQIKQLGLTTIREESPATGTAIRQEMTGNLVGIGRVGMHQIRVATLESLQIGTRKWRQVHVGLTSLEHWDLAKSGGPGEGIKGLLGPDLLNRHGALIDISNRKLWLRPEK